MRTTLRPALALTGAAALALGILTATPAVAVTSTASSDPDAAPTAVAAGLPAGVMDYGDDAITVPGLGDPLEASRERADTVRAASTPAGAASASVDHVYVVVVDVTKTTTDNENSSAELSDTNIKSAISQVSSFWKEESHGLVQMVTSSITRTKLSLASCDPDYVFAREQASAFGGRFAGSKWQSGHDHLLVLSSEDTACGHRAFGYIGKANGVIFSSYGVSTASGVPTLRHEFGHNLGFGHADSAICRNTTSFDDVIKDFDTSNADCIMEPYGDFLDIMGYGVTSSSPHLSTIEKIRAGWLVVGSDVTQITATSAAKTATIRALDTGSGVRAVRVVDPRSGELYTFEYRTGTGEDAHSMEFDYADREYCYDHTTGSDGYNHPITIDFGGYTRCFSGMTKAQGGIRVLRDVYTKAGAHESVVLAAGLTPVKPGDRTWRHSHLTTSDSFTSTSGGFTLTVNTLGGTASGAKVTVAFAAPVAPTVTLTSSRTTQTYGSTSRATLKVHATSVSGIYPAGYLGLYDGDIRLTSLTLSAAGNASYVVPTTATARVHHYVVKYSPSRPGFSATSSNTVDLTVAKATSTTVFGFQHSAITHGQHPVLNVVVRVTGISAPTGTVTAFRGTTKLAAHQLSGGRATVTLPAAAATETITVVYSGTASIAGSTSQPHTLTVS